MDRNDSVRHDFLVRCNILDTPRESVFDGLVFTAAQLFRTRMATLSLVDAERVWLKARVGVACSEIGRRSSFSALLLQCDGVLAIEDTWLDKRFAQNAVVTGTPYIRFCVGAPVTCPRGSTLGGLCVFDTRPRSATPYERQQLLHLANQASDLLAARVSLPA